MEDVVREKPVIERKREWHHGREGLGEQCPRAAKPVHTDPDKFPHTCHGVGCDNSEWRAGDHVWRDAKTKNVVRRVAP